MPNVDPEMVPVIRSLLVGVETPFASTRSIVKVIPVSIGRLEAEFKDADVAAAANPADNVVEKFDVFFLSLSVFAAAIVLANKKPTR